MTPRGKFRTLIIGMLLFSMASIGYLGVRSYYPLAYEAYILESAQYHDLDPLLIAAVIRTESRFRQDVISNKGAIGLMQLTDQTAKWAALQMGLDENLNVFDPKTNIHLGSWYLSYLMKRYDGDMTKVLSGYNAGTGNVSKWLLDENCSEDGEKLTSIPFEETKNYIQKVIKFKQVYAYLYSEKLEIEESQQLQVKK